MTANWEETLGAQRISRAQNEMCRVFGSWPGRIHQSQKIFGYFGDMLGSSLPIKYVFELELEGRSFVFSQESS
jgi:hypothetical protein